jgi:hypothetical protein
MLRVASNFGPFVAIIVTGFFTYLMLTQWGIDRMDVIGNVGHPWAQWSHGCMDQSGYYKSFFNLEKHGKKVVDGGQAWSGRENHVSSRPRQ